MTHVKHSAHFLVCGRSSVTALHIITRVFTMVDKATGCPVPLQSHHLTQPLKRNTPDAEHECPGMLFCPRVLAGAPTPAWTALPALFLPFPWNFLQEVLHSLHVGAGLLLLPLLPVPPETPAVEHQPLPLYQELFK